MSFAAPLALLGLLALPALAGWHRGRTRRRERAASAFVSAPLRASVAPRQPGWRRHVPVGLLALALVLLIAAAARARYAHSVPVKAGTVMLVNDVSHSMTATDVRPSRLAAAQQAAVAFTRRVPATIAVGSIAFAGRPTLLQSPSTDHALARAAIRQLRLAGGGTAIGDALNGALAAIHNAPKVAGKRPPGAIVLLSDGTSTKGADSITVAQQAKAQHVKIDTVAIGTPGGTQQITRGGHTVTEPAPVSPGELQQIAAVAGGTFYAAPSQARASAIYADLAVQLGHRKVSTGLTGELVGAALVLLVLSGGLSLRWFGRLT